MSRSIFVILKFKHAYLKFSVSGWSKQASIHKCVCNEVCQARPNQNKVGSEVTHYRPTKFKLRPSCSFKHTHPYLVWVNLLNEDVLLWLGKRGTRNCLIIFFPPLPLSLTCLLPPFLRKQELVTPWRFRMPNVTRVYLFIYLHQYCNLTGHSQNRILTHTRSLWVLRRTKRREGASNFHTLFVPSSVKSRTLNFGWKRAL